MQLCQVALHDVLEGCAADVASGGTARGDVGEVQLCDGEKEDGDGVEGGGGLGGVVGVEAEGERDGVGVHELFDSTAMLVDEEEGYGFCDSCHDMELRK